MAGLGAMLPLWASVVLTATDVLIFLLFADPTRGYGRPARVFELVIVLLVLAVFSCFLVLLVKVKPYWSEVFLGYLPSKGLFQTHPDAVYSAVGILGATVMPHALFLGSSLAAQDRVSLAPPEVARLPGASPPRPTTLWARAKAFCAPLFRVTRAERVAAAKDYRTRYGARENNSLTFIRQHLTHGIVDVVTSLLGVAVPINSAILILSATVFFEGPDDHDHPTETPAGLFEAYDLIKAHMGHGAATIFALALVCAGQASSITATLAGQIVSEGFIEWRVSPFLRRLVTRLISLIPAVVVALAVGRDGINTLLIASQVALSVVLPFIALPLIYLTSSRVVMRVGRREVREAHDAPERDGESVREVDVGVSTEVEVVVEVAPPEVGENRPIAEKAEAADVEGDEMVDYSNGWVLLGVAYAIWGVVLVANVYAIVSLGMRTGSA
ncbi:hypothetical protein DXG01_009526 [Tephrocybe rancida]|nr:hypothetical protein DXG01_009526 [Tephrocybe rancida]